VDRVQQALQRIEQVRATATGDQSAYLMRGRTNRMLLSVQRAVALEYGLDLVTPTLLDPQRCCSARSRDIAILSNKILMESKSLSQRSAALDSKWQEGWLALSRDLLTLEGLLRESTSPKPAPGTD
jgi:hypothetical protein